jgi:hypothetical protein
MNLEILRDLKYVGLCEICNGALWIDSYFRVYKNSSEDHICEIKRKINCGECNQLGDKCICGEIDSQT